MRAEIIKKSQDFFKKKFKDSSFVPGETYIPVTGKVLDESDGAALIEASLDMWLTAGRFANQFEHELPKVFGKKLSKLTVSGSAANLLAFATLTSWKLGEARIKPGSEVITVAAGFPTTVAPIVQYGCIPVFVDTLNTDASTVFVAYAICEGEVGGIYDIHFDGTPSVRFGNGV